MHKYRNKLRKHGEFSGGFTIMTIPVANYDWIIPEDDRNDTREIVQSDIIGLVNLL